MSRQTLLHSVSRRKFLSHGVAFTVGSATGLATTPAWGKESEGLSPCWQNDALDATWTPFGHVRIATVKGDKGVTAVPLAISSTDDLASVEWRARLPVVRFGKGHDRIEMTPRGVRLPKGEGELPWSKETVTALRRAILGSDELQRAVFSLRLAMLATVPEFVFRRNVSLPPEMSRQFAKSMNTISRFGKGAPHKKLWREPGTKGTDEPCQWETRVETVTTEIVHVVDIVRSAAEQLAGCLAACASAFGGDLVTLPHLLACEAGCLLKTFVDVVVGTYEWVETIVNEVVTSVLVCTEEVLEAIPNPMAGMMPSVELAQAFPAESGEAVNKAIEVVSGLAEGFGDVVDCILEGDWKITRLEDIGLNIDGVSSVPVGVTVCLDSACTEKLLTAGPKAIVTIAEMAAMANAVPAAVAALGLAAATAAAVTQVCLVLIAFIAILLAHLAIIAGQILIYKLVGAADDGVCITHPSLPVVAVTVVNPLAGLIAAGNTPMIVTPA